MFESCSTTEILALAKASNRDGKSPVADAAFRRVQPTLVLLAKRELSRRKRPDVTVETDALVNEVHLRLILRERGWRDSDEYYSLARKAIRNLLISAHRNATSKKRGGDWTRISAELAIDGKSFDIVAIEEAVQALERDLPRHAELVYHLFYLGMTQDEVCKELELTRGKLQNDWRLARAWLWRYLTAN